MGLRRGCRMVWELCDMGLRRGFNGWTLCSARFLRNRGELLNLISFAMPYLYRLL